MLVHFIIFVFIIIITVLTYRKKPTKKTTAISFLLLFILFFTFAAFRDFSVGNDTQEYKRIFDEVSKTTSINAAISSTRYEPGYIVYNYIISRFTDNFQIVLIFNSAIYIFASLWFIRKYSNSFNKAALLFFTFGLYYITMNIARQCIAISLFLFAVPYLTNKKYFKYILLISLATLFHSTSIILMALIVIPEIHFEKRKDIIKWGIIAIIILVIINYVINYAVSYFPYIYHYYANSIYGKGGTRIASIAFSAIRLLGVLILLIINRGKLKETDNNNITLNKMLFLDCVISIASVGFNLYDRIEKYMCLGYIVAITNYIESIEKPTNKTIAYIIMVVVTFGYLTLSLVYRPEWSGIFPYSFYTQQ